LVVTRKLVDPEARTLGGIVVICTKDRPDWVERACRAVARDRPTATIVLVDGSSDDATRDRCRSILAEHPDLELRHERAERVGLTRQRNQGIRVCADLRPDIVHFLDDDAEILPGYLQAIEERFRTEPDLAGVGGRVQNASTERHPRLSALFLLSGKHPYTVRVSGRVVMPRPSDGNARRIGERPVRWLQGFAMSYKMSVLERHQFEERLEGYCFGEDRDFAFRVSRTNRLTVEPDARCLHHSAAENRVDHRRLGRDATAMTYAWVSEQRGNGLSRVAALWSAVGDLLQHGVLAFTGEGQNAANSREHVRGVLEGLVLIASGRASDYTFHDDRRR
jgi:GT2 family glycosyltransferase